MEQPKFKVGQKVKFHADPDGLAGKVLSFTYDSGKGFTYRITSRAFDAEKNDMIEGHKICAESELVAVAEQTEGATQ